MSSSKRRLFDAFRATSSLKRVVEGGFWELKALKVLLGWIEWVGLKTMLNFQICQSSSSKILEGWENFFRKVEMVERLFLTQFKSVSILSLLFFFHSTSQYLNPDQGLDQVLTLIFYLVTSLVPYRRASLPIVHGPYGHYNPLCFGAPNLFDFLAIGNMAFTLLFDYDNIRFCIISM